MTAFPIIQGQVIDGHRNGRTIGFPTANLDVDVTQLKLTPGVYFGTCELKGKTYFCLPYFGPRAVLGEIKNCFEVYIFDFDQEIYGQTLIVKPTHFLRAPVAFDSFDELKLQLEKDKAAGYELADRIKNV